MDNAGHNPARLLQLIIRLDTSSKISKRFTNESMISHDLSDLLQMIQKLTKHTTLSTRHNRIVFILLVVLVLIVLLGACSSIQGLETEGNDQVLEHPTATSAAVDPTQTPEPTATKSPASLYLSDLLPPTMAEIESLTDVVLTEDQNADLWFGFELEAPPGEVLYTSTWVYALASPFPTLTDDVSWDDLRAYWLGEPADDLVPVTRLHVPETVLALIEHHWGAPDADRVAVYQDMPLVDDLWEENAWVILPFEVLQPALKVITLDGYSPLFMDFEVHGYPLAFQFNLIHNPTAPEPLASEVASIKAAIQPGNRDTEKMTTLVMTGVTALVRGTAYRMEQHGVLYPGEKIRPWLAEADLTHISNEVSFYEDCPFPDPAQESLFFCSDPSYIELLEYVGADIIELTGNHNNDMLYARGVDVVPYTLDLYQEYGMDYYGGGWDLDDAKKPLLVTHNGNRLAFIGCNAFGPDFAWATENQGGAAPCEDYAWMAEEITRLRSEGYLPIATFQYFEDDYDFVKAWHIRDYGLMAEAGAVIVNGSQAHRPKAMAFSHDSFIDYGLGNLFFDQKWGIDMYGNVMVQNSWVIIQRHTFFDGRHLHTELLTAILEDFSQPRPATPEERVLMLSELFEASGWISR